MLGRSWPRFALEAFFLLAIALIAGLLNLSVMGVVVVVAVAYLCTVVFEFVSWRARQSRPGVAAAAPIDEIRVHEPAEPESGAKLVVEEVEPEREPEPEPEPEPEEAVDPEAEAEPTAEPQPAEPQPDVEEPEPEPEPEPVGIAPQLVAIPEQEPEPDAEPEPVHEPEPAATAVATLPLPPQEQEWNLWELERLTRERSGDDRDHAAEWGYLVVYLREFARPDGTLPTAFDALVRESFGELLAGRAR